MRKQDIVQGEVYGFCHYKRWSEWGGLKPYRVVDTTSYWHQHFRCDWATTTRTVVINGFFYELPAGIERSESTYDRKEILVEQVDKGTLRGTGKYTTMPPRECRVLYAEGVKVIEEQEKARERLAAAHRGRVAAAQRVNAQVSQRLVELGFKEGGRFALLDSDFICSSKYSDRSYVQMDGRAFLRLLDQWAEDKACLAEYDSTNESLT